MPITIRCGITILILDFLKNPRLAFRLNAIQSTGHLFFTPK